jgi:hypothetical protein
MRFVRGVLLVMCLMLLVGCGKSSSLMLTVEAEPRINDGVLLPMDIMAVSEAKTDQILEIGAEDWFGDPLRDSLRPGATGNIQRLAISSDSKKVVEIKLAEDVERVVIFADFETATDRESQEIIIVPTGMFKNKIVIEVLTSKMRVKK